MRAKTCRRRWLIKERSRYCWIPGPDVQICRAVLLAGADPSSRSSRRYRCSRSNPKRIAVNNPSDFHIAPSGGVGLMLPAPRHSKKFDARPSRRRVMRASGRCTRSNPAACGSNQRLIQNFRRRHAGIGPDIPQVGPEQPVELLFVVCVSKSSPYHQNQSLPSAAYNSSHAASPDRGNGGGARPAGLGYAAADPSPRLSSWWLIQILKS